MMKMTIGKKIMGGFLCVITVVSILSGYTYFKIGQINAEYQAIMNANLEKVVLAQELATEFAEEVGIVRRFNLTGDIAAREKFNTIKIELNKKIERMEKLFITEKAQKLILVLKHKKAEYENFAEKAMEAKLANDNVQLVSYIQQGTKTYVDTEKCVEELKKMIKDFVKAEEIKISEQVSGNQIMLLFINIFIIVVSIIISVVISREISNVAQQLVLAADEIANGKISQEELRIKSSDEMGQLAAAFNKMKANLRALIQQVTQSTEQVGAASQQLSASAGQSAQAANQVAVSITNVARGTEQQMSAVNETSAVIQQMSAGVQQVATNANQVSEISVQASESTKAGIEAVDKAVNQMMQIEQTVNDSAKVVTTLGERSKEIGQIVDTISGIAGQTNLLALNAAIEAARAGEQGRGFAVVAEEVRKLAEQSQEAAKQIANLIRDIQEDTDQAVVAMNGGTREVKLGSEVVAAAGSAFKQIADLVTQVSDQVREISAAMQQMAGGSQQIVSSIKEIDELSKTTVGEAQTVSAATEEQSASAEQIAASSQALTTMAEKLQNAVSSFKI